MFHRFSAVAVFTCLLFSLSLGAQTPVNKPDRPKLVVGVMIDQMRWDYLYRFYDRFAADGGFKRMLTQGFSCENTEIPYAQTVTAAGHTCVYTGSVPALHGIMGNEWFDRSLGRSVYCVSDDSVQTIGGDENAAPMSPKNLWTTTVGDELRLATNFQSKTIGIALKDRASILPAGHGANAAYWYDGGSGHWVSSTYYMKQVPDWVVAFNKLKKTDSYYKNDWKTLYPIDTYKQSTPDDEPWEGKFRGETTAAFPHELKSMIGKNYDLIRATPFGNSITVDFAEKAISAEKLGVRGVTDFLAVSFSSPDYIGHQFGPNSVELEDNYLRLDKDLGRLLDYLDKTVGKGQYLMFLSADHAVAHVPAFLNEHQLPGGLVNSTFAGLNNVLTREFNADKLILAVDNYQIYLNDSLIDAKKLDAEKVKSFIIEQLDKSPAVLLAFDAKKMTAANLPDDLRERFIRGYNTQRGGDIQVVPKGGYFSGGSTGTTHGTFYNYDSHIPLLWYGWTVPHGATYKRIWMTDIAATLAAKLHIQMPSGCVGTPIPELTEGK